MAESNSGKRGKRVSPYCLRRKNRNCDITPTRDGDESQPLQEVEEEVAETQCGVLQSQTPATNNESQAMKKAEGAESMMDEELECAICLQECVHPAKLPCGHVFCYLCVKGVTLGGQDCPMCRAPIPPHYSANPSLLLRQLETAETDPSSSQNKVTTATLQDEKCVWFYEGRNGGWWQFEERMSNEIEEYRESGVSRFEMMICGSMYIVDMLSMIQYPKDCPSRVRHLLRDLPDKVTIKRGIAGIHSHLAHAST